MKPAIRLVRPQGTRMKCDWGCGEQLTASRMRTQFVEYADELRLGVAAPELPAAKCARTSP
jgi:hypothetical protein